MLEKKLTDEQIDAIIDEYLAPRKDPSLPKVTQAVLAKKYGVDQSTISKLLHNTGAIERLERRTNSRVALAKALLADAALDAAEKMIGYMQREYDEKMMYNGINATRDILDRSGVRAASEERQEVAVTFNGGIDLGVPDHSQDDAT